MKKNENKALSSEAMKELVLSGKVKTSIVEIYEDSEGNKGSFDFWEIVRRVIRFDNNNCSFKMHWMINGIWDSIRVYESYLDEEERRKMYKTEEDFEDCHLWFDEDNEKDLDFVADFVYDSFADGRDQQWEIKVED